MFGKAKIVMMKNNEEIVDLYRYSMREVRPFGNFDFESIWV